MDRNAVQDWLTTHCRLFPDFGQWWRDLPEATRGEIRDQWLEILRPIDSRDAVTVSRDMLAGRTETCPGYERSMLAARVAAAARELAAERQPTQRGQATRYRPSQPGEGPTAGEMFSEIMRRVDAGEDPHQASAAVIAPVAVDRSGRRYSCLACGDSGLVEVWHNLSIRSALAGTLETERATRRTMTVACSCRAADALCLNDDARKPKGWAGWRHSSRYEADRYCRCAGGDVDNPDRIAELTEWVADYHKRRAEPVTAGVFADWNEVG